jgi:hypothetical protein
LLQCVSPKMALSGHPNVLSQMSAFRGKADMVWFACFG